MKRVFIIQNTPLGEPLPLSVFLTNLLTHVVADEGYRWNLIVGKGAGIPDPFTKKTERLFVLPTSTYSIMDNLRFAWRVRRILAEENKREKIDIIHCFYPNSSLMGAVLFRIFSRSRAPILYDVRSPWIDMSIARGFIKYELATVYRSLLYAGEKFLCRRVSAFVFVTEGLADFYKKKVRIKSSQEVSVIPSGVDLERFRAVPSSARRRLGVRDDEIFICSVGGIAAVRKQDEFLPIFREVLEQVPEAKLVFVGEGDLLALLKEKTLQLGLEERVVYTGSVPHHQVPEIISACDFGLSHLPDMFVHRHNFSLKILEYLACGVPVLASRIDSNVAIARMLAGVHIYDTAADIVAVLRREGPPEVEKNLARFSWPRLARQYIDVYKGLK